MWIFNCYKNNEVQEKKRGDYYDVKILQLV